MKFGGKRREQMFYISPSTYKNHVNMLHVTPNHVTMDNPHGMACHVVPYK
jgi:hypothetical protein